MLEGIQQDIQATERALLLACAERGGADASARGTLHAAALQLLALLQQAARDELCSPPRSGPSCADEAGAVQKAAHATEDARMPDGQAPAGVAAEGSGCGGARAGSAAAALQGQSRECQTVLAEGLGREPVQELAAVMRGLYSRRLELQAQAHLQQKTPAASQAQGCAAAAVGSQGAGACPTRQQELLCSRPGSSGRPAGGGDSEQPESSAAHAADVEAQRLRGLLAEVRSATCT